MTGYEEDAFESSETLVRDRLQAAFGSVTVDSGALVGGGLAEGRRLVRRRRLTQLGAGIAAAAVIAVGGAVAVQQGLFDSHASAPASTVDELAPATPRGLATALLRHLKGHDFAYTKVGGVASPRPPHMVEADFVMEIGGRTVQLNTLAAPRAATGDISCHSAGAAYGSCLTLHLENGVTVISWSQGARSLYVIALRGNQAVGVQEKVIGGATPTELPWSMAVLRAIVTDPTVGFEVPRVDNLTGLRLPHFQVSGILAGTSGQGVSGGGSGRSSGSGSAPPPTRIHATIRPH